MKNLIVNDVWFDTWWETKRVIVSVSPLITKRLVQECYDQLNPGNELFYTLESEDQFRKQMIHVEI